jgi:arginine repressor
MDIFKEGEVMGDYTEDAFNDTEKQGENLSAPGENISLDSKNAPSDITDTNVRKSQKEEGMKILSELFTERPIWDKQDDIKDALVGKGVRSVSSATLYRWLIEIGAKPTLAKKGQWKMEKKDGARDEHLTALEDLLRQTADDPPLFNRAVKVAVLNTKAHYNHLIADAIFDAFKDEVICVFCPDDYNIVIYYKTGKDEKGKIREKSRLGEELSGIVRKIRRQNKKNS